MDWIHKYYWITELCLLCPNIWPGTFINWIVAPSVVWKSALKRFCCFLTYWVYVQYRVSLGLKDRSSAGLVQFCLRGWIWLSTGAVLVIAWDASQSWYQSVTVLSYWVKLKHIYDTQSTRLLWQNINKQNL